MSIDNWPADFDAKLYARFYPDLAGMDDQALSEHFSNHGKREGRFGSSIRSRADFLGLIDRTKPVLEIGPFLEPSLHRSRYDVKYFDVLDRDAMINRARTLIETGVFDKDRFDALIADAAEIDFVHPTGDLKSIGRKFANVISSHCGEHQPDLVGHLNDVYNLLLPGGSYFMILPDKRYGFDHYLNESRFVDVLGAHLEGRTLHSPAKVLEHRFETTHNDPIRHWDGDHGERLINSFYVEHPDLVSHMYEEARSACVKYVDVHNWIFTPDTFNSAISRLWREKFIHFILSRVYHTVRYSMEFYVILHRP